MKRMSLVVGMLGVAFLAAGCATPHQERAATTGAIVGATAGAVIGSESNRTAEGAIIGGVIGGLAGAVLAGEGESGVTASPPRYHRRACPGGVRYFARARQVRSLDRKIALMREGLSYCPDNPAAHNDLGVALMIRGGRGDLREARMHFLRALELDPGYLPARRNLERLDRMIGPRMHRRGHRHHDDEYRHRHHRKHHDHEWDEDRDWEDEGERD